MSQHRCDKCLDNGVIAISAGDAEWSEPCDCGQRPTERDPLFVENETLQAENAQLRSDLEKERNKHLRFIVEGGPVVMATDYDKLRSLVRRLADAMKAIELDDSYIDTFIAEWRDLICEARAATGGKEK